MEQLVRAEAEGGADLGAKALEGPLRQEAERMIDRATLA